MKKLTFVLMLVGISLLFQGCPHPVQPCTPNVIKEPFEVKVPVACQHPTCEEPILLPTDSKVGSYFNRAKNYKANEKMKEKHTVCLKSSVSKCAKDNNLSK